MMDGVGDILLVAGCIDVFPLLNMARVFCVGEIQAVCQKNC